jgi:hypothetical protein
VAAAVHDALIGVYEQDVAVPTHDLYDQHEVDSVGLDLDVGYPIEPALPHTPDEAALNVFPQ